MTNLPGARNMDCVCQVDLPMLPSLERNTQVAQHYEAGEARSPDPSAHAGAENEGGSAGGARDVGRPLAYHANSSGNFLMDTLVS